MIDLQYKLSIEIFKGFSHDKNCLSHNFASCLINIDYFMYRRPILCTLYGAVDFLNVQKKAVVGGGVCYWFIVKYIMYLQMMGGKKYWYVMYYITYQQLPSLTWFIHQIEAVAKSQRVSNKTGLELMIRLCLQTCNTKQSSGNRTQDYCIEGTIPSTHRVLS